MGRRGPPPKPAPLRLLEGNPSKRRVPREPSPTPGACPAPTFLDAREREVWERLVPELEAKKLMAPRYQDNFANLCRSIVAGQRAGELLAVAGPVVQRDGALVSNPASREFRLYAHLTRLLGADYGLTPAALTNIARANEQPDAPGGPARLLG
jgi:P27 family predicted phage terminase small subunit